MKTIFLISVLCLQFASLSDKSYDWMGTWEYEDKDGNFYTLTIEDKIQGMNTCSLEVKGTQLYYKLNCWGYEKNNSMEIQFLSVDDGVFYQEEKMKVNDVLFKFQLINNKVLTYGKKLSIGKSGSVVFKKK